MSEEDKTSQVMKDITEQVDNIITDMWVMAAKSIAAQDYNNAFNSLQSIHLAINPYNFDSKQDLDDYGEALEKLFSQLGSINPKGSEKQRKDYFIVLNEIKGGIKGYLNLITKSLSQLGKWLRVYDKQEDLDLLISDQSFGTEVTMIEEEKKILGKLDSSEMFSFFSKISIHNAYSRYLIKNAKP